MSSRPDQQRQRVGDINIGKELVGIDWIKHPKTFIGSPFRISLTAGLTGDQDSSLRQTSLRHRRHWDLTAGSPAN